MNNRILIDCAYIDFNKQPTGIPRVVLNYIEVGYEWGSKNCVEVIPVITTENGCFIVDPIPGKNPEKSLKSVNDKLDKLKKNSKLNSEEALSISNYLKEINISAGDILFCPGYWHDTPPANYRSAKEKGAKLIILVHDILPITHPKFYNYPWRHDVFLKNFIEACAYADALFTVSNYTANSIIEFSFRNKISTPPIIVSYNGYDSFIDNDAIRKIKNGSLNFNFRSPLATKVFINKPLIMVGSIEPKKGHIPVIDSLELMWRHGFEKDLVIIGRRGWKHSEIENKIMNSKYFNHKLFWFDDFDDLDLIFAYRKSTALVFSSIAEGFGLPIIEALNNDCQIIYLDTLISKEVARGQGLSFHDEPTFISCCISVCENQDAHTAKENIKWPSWEEYTPKVFSFMLKDLANLDKFQIIPL